MELHPLGSARGKWVLSGQKDTVETLLGTRGCMLSSETVLSPALWGSAVQGRLWTVGINCVGTISVDPQGEREKPWGVLT